MGGRQRFAVDGQRFVDHPRQQERLVDPRSAGLAEASTELGVVCEPQPSRCERRVVPDRNEQARRLVRDDFGDGGGRGRDHRAAGRDSR